MADEPGTPTDVASRLLEREQLLSSLTSSLPAVVYQFYAKGDEWGMNIVSARAREIFGIEPDPLRFVQDFTEHLPPEDRDDFRASIANAVAEETAWHYEGRFVRDDGREVYFRSHSVPNRQDDKVVFDGILLDTTEQRRAEEKLRHTQKLDSLGQLAGGVAHDFNNMLGGIMGAAELLADRLDDRPELLSLARMILETAERAGELTWQLLAFSRKAALAKKPVDVHEVLKQTQKILERSIDRRINLAFDLRAHSSIVQGDAAQLQAAFLNLGVNARDAMPAGGTLRYLTKNASLSTDNPHGLPAGEYLRVSVSDTGCGIPSEAQAHIFEPFFTTKPMGQGTGMGLAAAYGTLAEVHGSITLDSTSHTGTTFVVFIPLATPQSLPALEARQTPQNNHDKTILLVDDERVVRHTARRLMESLGYNVLEARDGVEAVEILKNNLEGIDVVILDMVMPQQSGSDTFSRLKDLRPALPIVLCSGYSLDESVEHLRKRGLAGHLSKPFRRKELAQVLAEALSPP